MGTPVRRLGPLGRVVGGYYLGGGKDITPDAKAHDISLRGHTTYVSLAQAGGGFPRTPWLDQFALAGGLVNYVLELKVYGAQPPKAGPAPDGVMDAQAGSKFYSWLQLLAGDLDGLLDQVAAAITALPYRIHLQVCSERDTDHQRGGSIGTRRFTWEQLDSLSVAGVQYLMARLRSRGVDNASFSAGMGGFDRDAWARCWVPGVNCIQYNAYNHGTWRPAADVLSRTYGWLDDLPAESRGLPVMIAEYGSQKTSGKNSQAAWIRSVPAALDALPRVAYAAYFNSGWGSISDPTSLDALADAYRSDPFLH